MRCVYLDDPSNLCISRHVHRVCLRRVFARRHCCRRPLLPYLNYTNTMVDVHDDNNWFVVPLAALSAVVLCVSSVLLLTRYSKQPPVIYNAAPVEEIKTVVRILYGTQTGTAEKFSKQLATALSEQYGQHQSFVIEDIEHFDRDTLGSQNVLLFVMATYGGGEPTDNALDFVEWLTKKCDDVMTGDCPEILKVRECTSCAVLPCEFHVRSGGRFT